METGAAAADEATGGRLTTRGSRTASLVEVRNLRKEYGTAAGSF